MNFALCGLLFFAQIAYAGLGNYSSVKVPSHIESLNKTLNTSLLIGKSTRDALQQTALLRALLPQPVKGVDELVEISTLASD